MGWWYILFWAVGLLLAVSVLMPKPQNNDQKAAALGDFRFPRIDANTPVPAVWGTVRIKGPLLVWYGDYSAVAIRKSSGGGLFGGGKKQTIGYNYRFGMQWLLCLGPGVVLRSIWAGKNNLWSPDIEGEVSDPNLPDGNIIYDRTVTIMGGEQGRGGYAGLFHFFPGDFDQERDPYLQEEVDPNVPAYRGFAHIVLYGGPYNPPHSGFYIGNSTAVDPFEFEVTRLPNPLGLGGEGDPIGGLGPDGIDCNPVNVVYDILTSTWGMLGLPVSRLDVDSFFDSGQTLQTENHGISIKAERAIEARDLIEQVLQQIDGLLYEDPESKKIVLKLIRPDYDVEELPVLDETNVVEVIEFGKSLWPETRNQVRVIFEDRYSEYLDRAAFGQDLSNFMFQGERLSTAEYKYPNVKYGALANALVARELAYVSVPNIKLKLRVNREAAILKPGDAFVFNWPEYRNLQGLIMRVQNYDQGDGKSNDVTLVATQDRFALTTSLFADPPPSDWEPPTTSPVSFEAGEFFVLEAPRFLLAADSASFGDPDAGRIMAIGVRLDGMIGYEVWMGEDAADDADYVLASDSMSFAKSAELDAAYPVTTPVDATGLTIRNLSSESSSPESLGITDATEAQVRAGRNIIMIGDEIMGFETITDEGGGVYTLAPIYRGLMDTIAVEHDESDLVLFLETEHATNETAPLAGVDLDVRGLTTSVTGQQLGIGLADNVDYTTVTRALLPYPPGNIEIDATPAATVTEIDVGTPVTVTMNRRSRLNPLLVTEADADEAPEVGQETVITYGPTGVEFEDILGGDATETWTPMEHGDHIVRVFARREGLDSLYYRSYNIVIRLPWLLTGGLWDDDGGWDDTEFWEDA
jgi:hypothetical protein